MQVFVLTFAVFALAMFGLAVGWLFNQRALKGSCGGISAVPGMEDYRCSCDTPCEKRLRQLAESRSETKEAVIEFKI